MGVCHFPLFTPHFNVYRVRLVGLPLRSINSRFYCGSITLSVYINWFYVWSSTKGHCPLFLPECWNIRKVCGRDVIWHVLEFTRVRHIVYILWRAIASLTTVVKVGVVKMRLAIRQLEQKQVPKRGTEPSVRKGKRSLLVSHIRCKYSMETTHNSRKVKLGIKVMILVESRIGWEVTVGQGSEYHLTFVRGLLHNAE